LISVIKSGAVNFVCRTYLNAFKLIVRDEDFTAGMKLLGEIQLLAKEILKEGSEVSEIFINISKFAKVVEILGLVVTVVSINKMS